MKIGLAASLALLAGACASGDAAPFDGNDDLHCSILMFHSVRAERSTDGRPPRDFALSAWYNKKIDNKPDLSKADPILKAAEANFGAAKAAIQTCAARANSDPNFKVFERDAAAAWKQAASEGAAAR